MKLPVRRGRQDKISVSTVSSEALQALPGFKCLSLPSSRPDAGSVKPQPRRGDGGRGAGSSARSTGDGYLGVPGHRLIPQRLSKVGQR